MVRYNRTEENVTDTADVRLHDVTSAESWMRYRRSQDALEVEDVEEVGCRYAGTGARTVRSESEGRGGMCLPCPVMQGGA
jgi:hypothetical protein